jgi:hypothetical protein
VSAKCSCCIVIGLAVVAPTIFALVGYNSISSGVSGMLVVVAGS